MSNYKWPEGMTKPDGTNELNPLDSLDTLQYRTRTKVLREYGTCVGSYSQRAQSNLVWSLPSKQVFCEFKSRRPLQLKSKAIKSLTFFIFYDILFIGIKERRFKKNVDCITSKKNIPKV